jgi:hypothetical protein
MLAEAEPGLSPLYQGCKQNRDNWDRLQEEHDKLRKFDVFFFEIHKNNFIIFRIIMGGQ